MERGGGIEPLDIRPAVLRQRLRRPRREHLVKIGALSRDRTVVSSLEDWRSTIELITL